MPCSNIILYLHVVLPTTCSHGSHPGVTGESPGPWSHPTPRGVGELGAPSLVSRGLSKGRTYRMSNSVSALQSKYVPMQIPTTTPTSNSNIYLRVIDNYDADLNRLSMTCGFHSHVFRIVSRNGLFDIATHLDGGVMTTVKSVCV